MCWACLVDGKVLLHWFDPGQSVNQHVYLDMLKTKVWPFVSHHATRKGYWFQQDGAKAHTAVSVRSWLTQKFHERVISHLMDRIWPPRSPDLSPLDYWFWGACLQELRRSPPRTIDELKATVEAYAASLTSEEISKAVLDILPRAEACILAEGGAFEYRLKQHKRLNGDGDNAHYKECVIKPPCETNTIHCYGDNNVNNEDNDGNQDLQYDCDLDSEDFCHVLRNANKWSEQNCLR